MAGDYNASPSGNAAELATYIGEKGKPLVEIKSQSAGLGDKQSYKVSRRQDQALAAEPNLAMSTARGATSSR